MKPVWEKLSDIGGRGEMYPAAALIITIGFVVAASAKSLQAFAVGTILRVILTCWSADSPLYSSDQQIRLPQQLPVLGLVPIDRCQTFLIQSISSSDQGHLAVRLLLMGLDRPIYTVFYIGCKR